MARYFLACRIDPKLGLELSELERAIRNRIEQASPSAKLEGCCFLLGPYDALCFLQAQDSAAALKAALAARALGIGVEVWPAVEAEALAQKPPAPGQESERKLDEAVEESFPASDPPAWTGVTIS